MPFIWYLAPITVAAICTVIRLTVVACVFARVLRGSLPEDRVRLFSCFVAAVGRTRSPGRRPGRL